MPNPGNITIFKARIYSAKKQSGYVGISPGDAFIPREERFIPGRGPSISKSNFSIPGSESSTSGSKTSTPGNKPRILRSKGSIPRNQPCISGKERFSPKPETTIPKRETNSAARQIVFPVFCFIDSAPGLHT